MTDRDGDDNFGETEMDEPMDLSTWYGPDAGNAPAPRSPVNAPPPIPGGAPPRVYEPTAPLPAGGVSRDVAAPAPVVSLPAGGSMHSQRRDFGPTEVDAPIDFRPTKASSRGGAALRGASPQSDLGLKLALAGLIVLIVVIVIAIIVGVVMSSRSSTNRAADESTESAN